jgi:hypothetical protein
MDSVTQAHAHLLQDGSIQFERSSPQPPVSAPAALHFEGGSWVFWSVVAVVLVGTAAVLLRQFLAGRSDAHARPPGVTMAQEVPASGVVKIPASALPEADALAGAGRYGEAVHVLLLRGIAAIERRFPRALLPSHTSRDIARLEVLPASVRTAFSGIAERAEHAIFAERELTREDWDRCRALYAGLAQGGRP